MPPADAPTPIQACLDRLAAGDPAARDELIRVSRDRLVGLTRALFTRFQPLRRWMDSDDVLNAATLRLCRTLGAVPVADTDYFLALAAKNIRRELLDLVRHYFGPEGVATNHETPGADGLPHIERAAARSHDPSDVAVWQELQEQIGRLPDEERKVVSFRLDMGMTNAQIAAAVGVSERTVKRRYVAARLRLRRTYRENLEIGDFSDPVAAPTPLLE